MCKCITKNSLERQYIVILIRFNNDLRHTFALRVLKMEGHSPVPQNHLVAKAKRTDRLLVDG